MAAPASLPPATFPAHSDDVSSFDLQSSATAAQHRPGDAQQTYSVPMYAPQTTPFPAGSGAPSSSTFAPPQPPTFSPAPPLRKIQTPTEQQPQNPQKQASKMQYDDYISPMIALDAYSVPTIPLPPSPKRPASFFEGAHQEMGPAVFASNLVQDDLHGWESSTPFAAFTSSTLVNVKKVANTPSLGFGVVVSPIPPPPCPSPPVCRHSPLRCFNCGAYSNLYCQVVPRTGEWKCVFCGRGNHSGSEYMIAADEDFSQWPELSARVVDFVEAVGWRVTSASETTMAAPVMLLVDETLAEVHMDQLKISLLDLLRALPPSARIGIISYGASVSVFDLAIPGTSCADVFPGKGATMAEQQKVLLYGPASYIAPVHACLPIAQSIVASLRPYKGTRPERERKRCLGAAVEVALLLIRGPATGLPRDNVRRPGGTARVVVCAGGPPTVGPGSIVHVDERHANYAAEEQSAKRHMQQLGRQARRLETAVDVFCAGENPVHSRLLLPVAGASGGMVLLQTDFGKAFAENLVKGVGRVVGGRGVLEVRTTVELNITRVIGPVRNLPEGSSSMRGDGSLPGQGGGEVPFYADSATALEMMSVEQGQGITLSLELDRDLPKEDYVYFQVSLSYVDVNQIGVTRVITSRLPLTSSTTAYLRTVNEDVAAVVIAKRTVVEAETAKDAAEMRKGAEERVKDLAKKFGAASSGRRSYTTRFPKELPRLAESLYHLRMGPLLGDCGREHEDERQVLRQVFMQAGMEVSLRMLVPRLLLLREGADASAVVEVPPYDLALQSNTAFVLDHGTDIFIWIGRDLAQDSLRKSAAESACVNVAAHVAAYRFPVPRLLSFEEGSSEARYVLSRLVPALKDPTAEQEIRFPLLRELLPVERAALKGKAFATDDPSFCEWMRRLRITPPDPPAANSR